MARRSVFTAVVLLALCAAACGDEERELLVDLRTDLQPGVEFDTIETVATVAGLSRDVTVRAARADDFIRGQRVAELRGLPAGQAVIEVSLVDPTGGPVVSRKVRVSFAESRAITLVVTRSCRGVSCAEDRTCFATTCVDIECGPDDGAACGTAECMEASDCMPASACADVECGDGVCLQVARHDRCAASERCAVERGCVPDLPPVDSGMPDTGPRDTAVDSSPADTGAMDTGTLDTGAPDAGVWTTPFGPAVRVDALSTARTDDDPTLTPDMLEIFFVSNRAGPHDLWTSTRTSTAAPFAAPSRVSELSSAETEVNPMLSRDGLTMWLGRGTNTFVSTRSSIGGAWSTPVEVSELNVDRWNLCPAPGADGLSMVQCAIVAGPFQYDLKLVTRATTSSPWSGGTLVAAVNSPENDTNAYFGVASGLELWFTSDRPDGVGDRDIWMTRRTAPNGVGFGAPLLAPGINTASAEENPWVSDDGRTLFFVSDRAGDKDLYVATR